MKNFNTLVEKITKNFRVNDFKIYVTVGDDGKIERCSIFQGNNVDQYELQVEGDLPEKYIYIVFDEVGEPSSAYTKKPKEKSEKHILYGIDD